MRLFRQPLCSQAEGGRGKKKRKKRKKKRKNPTEKGGPKLRAKGTQKEKKKGVNIQGKIDIKP